MQLSRFGSKGMFLISNLCRKITKYAHLYACWSVMFCRLIINVRDIKRGKIRTSYAVCTKWCYSNILPNNMQYKKFIIIEIWRKNCGKFKSFIGIVRTNFSGFPDTEIMPYFLFLIHPRIRLNIYGDLTDFFGVTFFMLCSPYTTKTVFVSKNKRIQKFMTCNYRRPNSPVVFISFSNPNNSEHKTLFKHTRISNRAHSALHTFRTNVNRYVCSFKLNWN